MDRRRQSTDRVEVTQQGIARLRELRARLVEAETAQRGFLITGDSTYLAPYTGARRDVVELLTGLVAEAPGGGVEATILQQLQRLITERLAVMEEPVALRAAGFEQARDVVIA